MMKKIQGLLLLLLIIPFWVLGQSNFNSYFHETGSVRYDFDLTGDHCSAFAVHQQTKYLPLWGGNPKMLIDELNYGTYRYQLFDLEGGTLIFQKGFSPLFWEWQDTHEARLKKRSFNHSLFFPKPKADVIISLQTRDSLNSWSVVYTDTLFVNDYFIINEDVSFLNIDTIIYHGVASEKIDLVIIAEGYQEHEMQKFIDDASRMANYLFAVEPFKTYKNRFNVFAVKVLSMQSGTDIPGEGIYRNTAFNSHFYTFDSPRYLTTTDMKAVYDAVDALAWDQLYLLVNEERYGGGGFYNFLSVSTSDNAYSLFVFCHEFAHGFAALADEYYSPSTAYEEYYRLDAEPWEPNITTLVNFESKWKAMVEKEIPVPTPRETAFQDEVGVYEGGGYQTKGIYSPMQTCWMKEQAAGVFCPVCQKAIEKVILSQTK